jgi:hypothetical protein
MPRARRPGDAFVPIVCARARVHGYGCVWGAMVCLVLIDWID